MVEQEYWDEDLDPKSLRVAELRKILLENDITFSGHDKKSDLVKLFRSNVRIIRANALRMKDARPDSAGVQKVRRDGRVKEGAAQRAGGKTKRSTRISSAGSVEGDSTFENTSGVAEVSSPFSDVNEFQLHANPRKRRKEEVDAEDESDGDGGAVARRVKPRRGKGTADQQRVAATAAQERSVRRSPIAEKVQSKRTPTKNGHRSLMIHKFESSSEDDSSATNTPAKKLLVFERSSEKKPETTDFTYPARKYAAPDLSKLKVSPEFKAKLAQLQSKSKSQSPEKVGATAPIESDDSSVAQAESSSEDDAETDSNRSVSLRKLREQKNNVATSGARQGVSSNKGTPVTSGTRPGITSTKDTPMKSGTKPSVSTTRDTPVKSGAKDTPVKSSAGDTPVKSGIRPGISSTKGTPVTSGTKHALSPSKGTPIKAAAERATPHGTAKDSSNSRAKTRKQHKLEHDKRESIKLDSPKPSAPKTQSTSDKSQSRRSNTKAEEEEGEESLAEEVPAEKGIEYSELEEVSINEEAAVEVVSGARIFFNYLRHCAVKLFTFLLIVVPILFGLWYREQRVLIGYCGHEINLPTFTNSETSPFLSQLDSFLQEAKPSCLPCPENAICYPYMKIKCRPDYTVTPSIFSLYGLFPVSDTCVKDSKREKLIAEVVHKSLELLRTKNAQIQCGECEDDTISGISENELYQIFFESRAPWMNEDEFRDIWQQVVKDLKTQPEIVCRQVSIDRLNAFPFASEKDLLTNLSQVPTRRTFISSDTDDLFEADDIQEQERYLQHTEEKEYFRSVSKKYIGIRCQFERQVYRTYKRFTLIFWGSLIVVVIMQVLKIKLQHRFKQQGMVEDLNSQVIEKLKQAAQTKADGERKYLSTVQLRDVLLSDVADLKYKNHLWNKVVHKLESNNTNVKTMLMEVHGEIMKCWEWVGPVE
ncbi:AaceriAER303Wp [[Ashbya] aceris (nom. inval.)]|nr:AaceriAER303Wp [[Ashbya] aceris (nom. inval.)]